MTARPVPIRDEPHLEKVLGQIRDRLDRIEERMVTKDDAKAFLTKDDAKAFLTKDDAKAFLTKDDAKAFLTKDDAKAFATKDDAKAFATKDDAKAFATKDDVDVVVREMRVGFADVSKSLLAIHAKLDRR